MATDNIKRSRAHEEWLRLFFVQLFAGVKLQPGSGNQATAPNDIKVQNKFMIEAKCTVGKTMSVEHNWLKRSTWLAAQFGLPAMVAIRFCGTLNDDYFIISDSQLAYYASLEKENEQLRAQHLV